MYINECHMNRRAKRQINRQTCISKQTSRRFYSHHLPSLPQQQPLLLHLLRIPSPLFTRTSIKNTRAMPPTKSITTCLPSRGLTSPLPRRHPRPTHPSPHAPTSRAPPQPSLIRRCNWWRTPRFTTAPHHWQSPGLITVLGILRVAFP